MVISIHKRTLVIFFLAVAVFCALPFLPSDIAAESVGSTSSGNWGLSFKTPGKTPVGNASADFLKKYNAYFVGDESERAIYLTFDAGYENGNTEKILDALKKHNAPAAFFLVGNYIDTCPELVKRMVAEGHTVGNHTSSHPDMSAIASEDKFRGELTALEEKYMAVTGAAMPKFYRPPQGKFSEENLRMACDMGYTTVFWSLAYVDWYEDKQPSQEEALKKLTERIHPGAVVLLHSTSRTNGEILDRLLTCWEEAGYTFKGIDALSDSAL